MNPTLILCLTKTLTLVVLLTFSRTLYFCRFKKKPRKYHVTNNPRLQIADFEGGGLRGRLLFVYTNKFKTTMMPRILADFKNILITMQASATKAISISTGGQCPIVNESSGHPQILTRHCYQILVNKDNCEN